ncbi:Kunitz BPTI domain containing protein [Trichuris trichiura]|uniref:Kunitz BPTI domain containing protein n=1 Tax=Trichuris trichiura TaxID=36087 RepID=A0A077Z9R9_TRITR|nr:Kunitz BPTI domain containing protein [Trichuris trichiura]
MKPHSQASGVAWRMKITVILFLLFGATFASRRKSPCNLTVDGGPCKAQFTKYYYNKESKKCEPFVYGGCQGNRNRFDTLEECTAKCAEQKKQEDSCKLPAETGPCKASFTRYYYVWDQKKCAPFTYGGCKGNANNYESIAECEEKCGVRNKDKNPCELPAETGPCMASFIRFYYNKETKKCETFTYGGCQGNENNFETLEECEAKCSDQKKQQNPCKMGPDPGPCRAVFLRYYYSWDWKKCLKFTYGGCEGNANNFESLAQCEATCVDKKKKDNPCELPAEPGPCKASFLRYYYNKESKKCETFTYGGCEGNENSFETLKECEARCVKNKKRKRQETPCELPADTGPCKMNMIRYYYDKGSKKCKTFTYGGCHGNENNFESMEKCEATCEEGEEKEEEEQGPCRAAFTKYYYNKDTKQCETFIYGGCRGNANNFETKAESPVEEPPIDVGPPTSHRKWFFDTVKKVCRTFVYGGCKGNGNRFDTKEECQQRCIATLPAIAFTLQEENPCKLPADPGPCMASFIKHYYDWDSKQCLEFTYGGCEGNANNFETIEECQKSCPGEEQEEKEEEEEEKEEEQGGNPCELPAKKGPCRAAFTKYYYNKDTKQCETFIYGGCKGNANNFETIEECQKSCPEKEEEQGGNPCELPAKKGPCRAAFTKYYYNKDTKQCETFIYGGCKGNANNFETIEECQESCPGEEEEEEEQGGNPCELPAKKGPCRAAFTKYYYNKDTKQCETFIYGGCKGNANNFETKAECESRCSVEKDGDVCSMPKDSGPCKASHRKWFFDAVKKVCRTFVYGGCKGNGNRFDTKEECQERCVATLPASVICRLPYAMGSCSSNLRRFFFDFETKQCRSFTYTGCEGNANNFISAYACYEKCGKRIYGNVEWCAVLIRWERQKASYFQSLKF